MGCKFKFHKINIKKRIYFVEDVEEFVNPEGDRVRLVLPLTAGTVNFLAVGVVVPLDRDDVVTERRGIRLGVPSSVNI